MKRFVNRKRARDLQVHFLMIAALLVAIAQSLSTERALAQATTYTVVELSAPDADLVPCRLNNLGDFVGRGGDSGEGGIQATMWTHGTLKRKALGAFPGGGRSSASAINDAGEVAGSSNTDGSVVPFIWNPTKGLQRVSLLPGDNGGQGFGINKKGDLAGYSTGPNGARACLWIRNAAARDLGALPGGAYSRAQAVNDSDEVAGVSGTPSGNRAVWWTKTGEIRDLGTLPGDTASEAVAINNAGEVVGYSQGVKWQRAFLWTAATGMKDLGVLPGGNVSRALDINDSGEVVGVSASSSGDHAFIWTRQDGMTDLNSAASAGFGLLFIQAHAINNKGQILAMGTAVPDGETGGETALHADDCAPGPPSTFLLTPTPGR